MSCRGKLLWKRFLSRWQLLKKAVVAFKTWRTEVAAAACTQNARFTSFRCVQLPLPQNFLQNPGSNRRLPTCCVVVGMLTVCVGTVIVVAVEFLLFRVLDCACLVLLSEVRVVVAVAVLMFVLY